MARKKLLRVISRLWRHDSIWLRWLLRSLKCSFQMLKRLRIIMRHYFPEKRYKCTT